MPAPKGNNYAEANSKYDEAYNEQARKLCLLGHTDKELAKYFCVSEATINNWKKEYPKFLESINAGKVLADMEVAQALYDGTRDRVVIEQQAFKIKVDQYEERIEVVDVQKIIPADFRNQQFWLKNRQPGKWRDKQDITLAGDKENPLQHELTLDVKNMTDEQLRQIASGQG